MKGVYLQMMNNNFIKKINIDWQEISDNSYLKEISSISKLEEYRDFTPKEIFYERYGGKSLHEQSHGESFLSFFQANAREGLYIMDEPEAALSPQSQLVLFIQIAKMAKAGSQFIIASHSPILLAIPDAKIYSFDNKEISLCEYEDTESYKVMKLFINDREFFLLKDF